MLLRPIKASRGNDGIPFSWKNKQSVEKPCCVRGIFALPLSIRKKLRPVRSFLHRSRGKCAPKACMQPLATTRQSGFCHFVDTLKKEGIHKGCLLFSSKPISRVLSMQPSIWDACCQTPRATSRKRTGPALRPRGTVFLPVLLWIEFTGSPSYLGDRWALTPPFHPYHARHGGISLLHLS